MPRKIDPKVKERCVQQMLEHVAGTETPMSRGPLPDPRRWFCAEAILP